MDLQSAVSNLELETLSRRYAAAVDHRDVPGLLSAFATEATVRVERPGREVGLLAGHRELERIVAIVSRWPRTAHILGQGLFQIDGEAAEGEVYCTAHHFSSDGPGRGHDHVMHIRYLDRYAAGPEGSWLIIHRTVCVDATENRPVHGEW